MTVNVTIMAKVMAEYVETGRPAFFVVGVGHLVGDAGVIERLRSEFIVDQISSKLIRLKICLLYRIECNCRHAKMKNVKNRCWLYRSQYVILSFQSGEQIDLRSFLNLFFCELLA